MNKETKDIIQWIIFIILFLYVLKIIKNNRKIIDKLDTEIELPDAIAASITGTTDSIYNNNDTTFATTCMDLRFIDESQGFLTKKYGRDLYDSFILPGASFALFDRNWSGTSLDESQLIDKIYYNAWFKTALIAKMLHNIKKIAIIDHEDCEYYKNLYVQKNKLPTEELSYIYDIDSKEKYTKMVKILGELIKDGISIDNVLYKFPMNKEEMRKYESYKDLDASTISEKLFLFEKGMIQEDKEIYPKLNFMIKLWQKSIHLTTMNMVIIGIKNKLQSYSIPSDTDDKLISLNGKSPSKLFGSSLADVQMEGWLMKMDGTVEKLYPIE